VKTVNLFAADQDRRGITSDSIKICGHAPLLLGPILGTKTEDLLVYWRQLNDKGGVHGRKIDMSLEDDRYESSGGVPAAQRCREKNPFFVFGAIGSDVIAPVRVWAEQNRELYIYGFSVRKGSEKLRYSYTATIGSEDISRVLADVALTRFPSKKQKIGLVWRNSSNVEPAAIAFRQRVAQAGGKIVADIPVQQSQGNYSQEVIELQQRGAEVVYIGDDALSQINMMKQAKTQNYNPNWLVFSFNLQTQTLKEDSLGPPLTGANLAPAYACNNHSGTYAPYAADIKEFEAAYAKYSPNTDLCGPAGDVAFGTWLGFKAMAGLLEVCGRDCSRNTLAGIFEAGYKVNPGGAGCPVDFSRDAHHGGYGVNLMEAYRLDNGDYGWKNLKRCVTAL
jgi:branched-chain amino acid transport system substrate-binding protein